MIFSFVVTALFGVVASAAPQAVESYSPENITATPTSPAGSGQTPFQFPLVNGFPANLNGTALMKTEKQAHGTLPNSQLPTNITDVSATTFGLIAFNEIFEVAFFTDLLYNITNSVQGYDVGYGAARTIVVNALTAIQAQEEFHAAGANAILSTAGRTPIQPCKYVFPTKNFDDAIVLASTFTDVVLGALQDALANFGADGDTEFLALVGSVIGQEGEQEGYFRLIQSKIPSALPFLTRVPAPFAFSVLNQMFVVPGSCPNIAQINLPIFSALKVATPEYESRSQNLTFSFNGTASSNNISVAYINQQNLPVTVPVQNLTTANNVTTFTAYFPYDEYLLNDLTIAAVVRGANNFTSAAAVANATLYGPGIILLN